MDKTLRNTIIAGILIITLSIGYYFIFSSPKKIDTQRDEQITSTPVVEEAKEIKVGDEFFLKNGRKITVTEVEVGNYYVDGYYGNTKMMKAQVSIRINSDGGPLNAQDYDKMYILQGNQLIKLSNSKAAYWGQYWFEMPKTNNFDGMRLYFGEEATVALEPYIKANNL